MCGRDGTQDGGKIHTLRKWVRDKARSRWSRFLDAHGRDKPNRTGRIAKQATGAPFPPPLSRPKKRLLPQNITAPENAFLQFTLSPVSCSFFPALYIGKWQAVIRSESASGGTMAELLLPLGACGEHEAYRLRRVAAVDSTFFWFLAAAKT